MYVKKYLLFPFSLFFWFSITILSYTLILPKSQLQTQQLMKSQIRPHKEYLIQYSCAHFIHKIDEKNIILIQRCKKYTVCAHKTGTRLLIFHHLSVPTTWRRGFVLCSMTSLHFTYCLCRCAVFRPMSHWKSFV